MIACRREEEREQIRDGYLIVIPFADCGLRTQLGGNLRQNITRPDKVN
jgi:hypothetical protein